LYYPSTASFIDQSPARHHSRRDRLPREELVSS
jgi:hypothetical protein